jgi:hypothetical protein
MSRLLAGLLISAGAVAALVYAAFRHDLSKARAALDGRSAVIETALGTIEYAKTGKGFLFSWCTVQAVASIKRLKWLGDWPERI